MTMVILGLGANLGLREKYLHDAITQIKLFLTGIHCSHVYESSALLLKDAPAEWNRPYLNMAVRGNTTLKPQTLLKEIKKLEQLLGRTPSEHWGPREIDIDILAYGDEIISQPTLTIPHRELLHRDFALIPLADVAPDWVHPQAEGATAYELAAHKAPGLMKTDIVIT